MRTYFEELEAQTLAPYAIKSKHSKGREHDEPPSPSRTCFQRDRDRIIHSKSFRRLKHKTQVFVAYESDHYRSRLTHTLEVSQISRHLSRIMRLNEDLAESIALAHDLGHTPFGHSGERQLNELMKPFGGYEHNLQSRRIVDELEDKYPNFKGLNLSFEVREGLIKHTTPWDHPNQGEGFISLEAQVCNLADEIAYNNHDLDDGISSGLLHIDELEKSVTLWKEAKNHVKAQYHSLENHQLIHLINSYLISTLIEDVVAASGEAIAQSGIRSVEDVQQKGNNVICFSRDIKEKNTELRKYLFTTFYSHVTVYKMNKKGQHIIKHLFDAYTQDTRLLPERFQKKIRANTPHKERIVADYIAGMTDNFAKKEYEAIFI